MWTEGVAEDRTSLTLALDSTLAHLPEGASYTAASGRAKVKASVKQNTDGKPPTLVIESSCDSLERVCVAYAQNNERLSVVNASLERRIREQSEERLKSARTAFDWWAFAAGALAGAVIVTILIIKTRKV